MVDLHQAEPGLPEGHPWLAFSRWQMAWRSFLGVSLVGMVGTLFFSAITAGNGGLNLIESAMPFIFAMVLPLIAAVLASAFGQRLKRYYPFSQSLLFAAITVVAVVVLTAVLSVWDSLVRGPCPADTLCSAPLDGAFWVIFLLGFPVFLSSCVGYGLAIWASTKRGTRVFWPVWGGVLVLFVVAIGYVHFLARVAW